MMAWQVRPRKTNKTYFFLLKKGFLLGLLNRVSYVLLLGTQLRGFKMRWFCRGGVARSSSHDGRVAACGVARKGGGECQFDLRHEVNKEI